MNDFLSQLNLTVQERRIVIGIFIVVFIVINYLFVWPRFGEWSSTQKQLGDMRNTIANDNRFILKDTSPGGWRDLVKKFATLEGNDSSAMEQPQDPQIQLSSTIRQEAHKSEVHIDSENPGSVKTNDFFEEHSILISIESQEPPLINFLYNMGNDPAMIRVGRLHLRPSDDHRYRLRGEITMTANYSRKAPAAAAPAKPIVPGPKPAAASGKPAAASAKPAVANTKPATASANPAGGRKTPPGTNSRPAASKMPAPQPGPGGLRKPQSNLKPAPGAGTNR